MHSGALTLFCAIICCCSAEKSANVSLPNIIIMLMDDVSYFFLHVSLWLQFITSAVAAKYMSPPGCFSLCGFSGVDFRVHLNVWELLISSPFSSLLFRWAGGTWGCLASPLKRPPTWMPWLLRACCFLISTLPTHSVPHVSQREWTEHKHGVPV